MKRANLLKLMMAATLSLLLFGCKPDLKIASLTHLPEMPTTEDTITFTATVKNTGSKTADPSTLGFKVGGGTPTRHPVPALEAGESYDVERQGTLSTAQRYRNTATADFENDVSESNENNNQKIDEYTVIKPITEDCVSFDPRKAEVKQINGRWKIVDGSHWLFDFGDKRDEAETALWIIKKYGFTHSCFVGRPDASFFYLRR